MATLQEGYVQLSTEKFFIGKDNFGDLEIRQAPSVEKFYYFFNKKTNSLIKQFILDERQFVDYVCFVTLIKKANKFTPRFAVSIRDKYGKIRSEPVSEEMQNQSLKANVNLDKCYENFWDLVSFFQKFLDIDVPKGGFSLISQGEREIVSALQGRDAASLVNIIKRLSSIEGVMLSEKDINQVLKHKERLSEFNVSIKTHSTDEAWWENFFERNKWIFGYGLNYHILKSQPNYGGTNFDGKGGQRGDYLTATKGKINFTCLVEIKTPNTPLIRGNTVMRNGAWSLSKELIDAISQINANKAMWERNSKEDGNRDILENAGFYTVQPRGVIVIGSLEEISEPRSKRETFNRFRETIHGIDILTFDELLNRASFIVEES